MPLTGTLGKHTFIKRDINFFKTINFNFIGKPEIMITFFFNSVQHFATGLRVWIVLINPLGSDKFNPCQQNIST